MRAVKTVILGRFLAAAVVSAGVAFGAGAVKAQTNGVGERFSAVAVDLDRGTQIPLQIVIDRWTSDAERDRLMTVMLTKGADQLLDALRDAPKVGYIRTNTSLGWDLHYAERVPGEDGGERIVVATDRPMSAAELWDQSRSTEYPFTVIEMRVNRAGEGDGSMSFATKVIPDRENNIVTLENYGEQRTRLQQVKREGNGN